MNSSMVFRLGVFFIIHVSVVIGIGITDQRNWMHESAKPDVIFVASWPLRAHAYSISFALWSVESPQTSPEKVVHGELVQERDLETVQEENFLVPGVHECSAPG